MLTLISLQSTWGVLLTSSLGIVKSELQKLSPPQAFYRTRPRYISSLSNNFLEGKIFRTGEPVALTSEKGIERVLSVNDVGKKRDVE